MTVTHMHARVQIRLSHMHAHAHTVPIFYFGAHFMDFLQITNTNNNKLKWYITSEWHVSFRIIQNLL